MKIVDFFQTGRPVFSFEFFPPKSEAGISKLLETIEYLGELSPDFVSVTYGAGGGTKDFSISVASAIKKQLGIEPIAHITSVGHSLDDINTIVERMLDSEIENFLGLRGDPPKNSELSKPAHFEFANELIEHLSHQYQVCVGGACYPEKHIDSPSLDADLNVAKLKVDAGAKFLMTQLFFDNQYYFDFVRRAREIGIQVPIIPGIMPVTNVSQVEKFAAMCGTTLPEKLLSRLKRFESDEQAVLVTGIEWATEQCLALLEGGAPGIHFYTLNKSLATRLVYRNVRS